MSNAHKCPLVHRLNSLQIQPLQSYASHDTFVHPDDHIDIGDETSFIVKDNIEPLIENYDRTSGDAYTPPLAKQLALRRINIHSITRHKVPDPPKLHHNLVTAICAQLDTGADITCTNMKDCLHDYRSYDKSFPCKI